MADNTNLDTAVSDEAKARAKADEAQRKASEASKSPEQRKADEAETKADDAAAKADQARAEDDAKGREGPATTAAQAKADSAVDDPDRSIGDHHVQRFANTPANPQLAPRVPAEIPEGQGVRLELNDSDHPDPKNPKVAYVHPDMVGDYQRAGWRYPVA